MSSIEPEEIKGRDPWDSFAVVCQPYVDEVTVFYYVQGDGTMNAADEVLTVGQRATNFETMRHMERVRNLIDDAVMELLRRGQKHDQSKLAHPEIIGMEKHTKDLAGLTYGTAEYRDNLKQEDLAKALEHHYAHNRHHPQHFPDGVNGMNLIDVLEMLIDWKAASERHLNGNIRKSLEANANRYEISPQLLRIMENTVEFLFRS